MPDWTRRTLLSGALGSICWIGASPSLAHTRLHAPVGAMLLSRKLVRGLSDGNRVIVERTWEITFSVQGSGLAVEGSQVAVRVSVPDRLEPIAEIERERITDDQFPILIGPDGLIIAAGEAEKPADIQRAIEVAEQMIADSGSPVSHQRRLNVYLAQIQASGNSLLERLPSDLFFPKSKGFTERRPVSLPGGQMGEFLVNYTVSAQPVSGLLNEAKRQIITRVAGTEQTSSEHWKLRSI